MSCIMLLFGWAGDLDGVYSTLVLNYLLTYLLLRIVTLSWTLSEWRVTEINGDWWRSVYTSVYTDRHQSPLRLSTALHLDTCLTFFAVLLTCRLVVVYGRDFQPTWCPHVASRNCRRRSFSSVGPKLWNSLPDDITSASLPSVFRKKLSARRVS